MQTKHVVVVVFKKLALTVLHDHTAKSIISTDNNQSIIV